ncbi:MAG: cell division protein FtsH [Calothrix sp. FI2-JRJ7]|jgi:cell division protease FtsH|nr:cell division protein FtsH [Calothrix sp. FI2-JRJ7]
MPKKTDEKDKRLEQWSYTKFIREVKGGAVERVSLSADRSKVMVKSKNDAKKKLVYLVDDPELINTLTTNNVDISVLP